jgi:glutaredoxin
VHCLRAWADSLGGISYPLLSDFWPHGEVAECYGVLRPNDGFTERAIFVIDGAGIIRYIDIHAIDDQPDNEEVRKILREIEGKKTDSPVSPVVDQAQAIDSKAPVKEIILYCAKWCRDCVKAKTWLEQHGLAYVEVDIDYEPEARKQVREWGGGKLITPVIDFYGTIIVDYDVAKLEEALEKRVE